MARALKQTARVTKRTLIPTVLGILLATTLYEARRPVRRGPGPGDVPGRRGPRDGDDFRSRPKGRVITDLKQSDFEIIDYGAPRPIQTFESGESPVSIAILVDISGSMAVGGNIQRARTAVTVAMAALRTGPTKPRCSRSIPSCRKSSPSRPTSLACAACASKASPGARRRSSTRWRETARLVADRPHRHRAVFVITDGVDTGSRLKAPEVSAIASTINVPVYLLTVVNPVDHPGGDFGVLTETKADGVGHARRPGALDWRRYADRQHARAHGNRDRRSVRRASSPVSDQLRAG